MTVALDFQGQILKIVYLRNGMTIDLVWKECEWIESWTHVVTFDLTLTLDFKGQILKKSYLRNGMADWHGTKGMWVDRMLHPIVTFNVHLTHDLHLGFARSNFENAISQKWVGRLTWNERDVSRQDATPILWLSDIDWIYDFHLWPQPWPWTCIFQVRFKTNSYLGNGIADWPGIKGMWVDKILDPYCDYQRSPYPWPWIFKVKFWKRRISGMGWLIDMEQKGFESIKCWTHEIGFAR